MNLLVLKEPLIRELMGPRAALEAVRDAFVRLARGEASLPGVIGLDLPAVRGEVHVKGAWLHGTPFFSIKEAAGFYDNEARGLPVGSGLILVFDAETGLLRAILFDNAYLTELRTGAAGALAAELLSRPDSQRVALIGAGSQARYQLAALREVRDIREVLVWSRTPRRALECAAELAARHGVKARAVGSVREAVELGDIVVTVTPARTPLVKAEWLRPGQHVTAVGSDGPDKQELEAGVVARADTVVADRLDQCLRLGEIHHAVAAGVFTPERVHAELGEIAAGLKPGRRSEAEITLCDLTGVGVQDAGVANRVVAEALRSGLGETLTI
jgi:ectoine utilization protein EutC